MKKLPAILLLLLICSSGNVIAQNAKEKTAGKAAPKPEEQIRKYYFVMLTRGEQTQQDSATRARIQAEHLANIDRLYYEGKIKVAGPFGDNGDWRGLFIFDCATKEEVENLLKSDPAISSGRLKYDIRPWYTAPMGSFVPGKPEKPKTD